MPSWLTAWLCPPMVTVPKRLATEELLAVTVTVTVPLPLPAGGASVIQSRSSAAVQAPLLVTATV